LALCRSAVVPKSAALYHPRSKSLSWLVTDSYRGRLKRHSLFEDSSASTIPTPAANVLRHIGRSRNQSTRPGDEDGWFQQWIVYST